MIMKKIITQNCKGQAIVETALVLMLIVMFTFAITDRLARDLEMASAIDSGVDPSGYSRFEPSGKDTLIMRLTFVFRGRIKHFAGSLNPPSGNDFEVRS